MLGGGDGRTLYIVANRYDGTGASDGIVLAQRVDVPTPGDLDARHHRNAEQERFTGVSDRLSDVVANRHGGREKSRPKPLNRTSFSAGYLVRDLAALPVASDRCGPQPARLHGSPKNSLRAACAPTDRRVPRSAHREIDHALRPAVHERRIPSGGPSSSRCRITTWASGTQLEITRGPVDQQPLAAARRFATGFRAGSYAALTHERVAGVRPTAGSERILSYCRRSRRRDHSTTSCCWSGVGRFEYSAGRFALASRTSVSS